MKVAKMKIAGRMIDELGGLQLLSSETLAKVARGELDLNRVAVNLLAGRGLDENAEWVGFANAEKIHFIKPGWSK